MLKARYLALANPFLAAIFPILYLYGRNVDEVPLGNTLTAILVVLAATLVFLSILWLLLRDGVKAGFIASLWLVIFFAFGHVYDLIEGKSIAGLVVGRYSLLLIVTFAVALVPLGLAFRYPGVARAATSYITGALVVLIVVNVVTIIQSEVSSSDVAAPPLDGAGRTGPLAAQGVEMPDIYYIILDSYARQDVLQDLYNFDNSGFLNYLMENNFYVASQSRPNYVFTFLSLSSSLNMQYLDHIPEAIGTDSTDHSIPHRMIRENKVMQLLKEQGYRVVLLPSPWSVTASNPQADVTAHVYSAWNVGQAVLAPIVGNDFGSSLLVTTALAPFARKWGWISTHEAALFTNNMSELKEIPDMEGPNFTFAHFFPPHAPYLFDRDGNVLKGGASLTDPTDKVKYVDQLIWVNKSIQDAIDHILRTSEGKSVIVVQGDHGPASLELETVDGDFSGDPDELREKASILNAYYLPESCDSNALYESMTPINSFRLIFDACFGTDFGLLEDRTFWSRPERPFKYIPIEDLFRLSEES